MPLYEYECQSCGRRSETLQRMDDPKLTICPECGGPLKKLFSTSGFKFKGSGWYVTDYAKKSGSQSSSNGGSDKDKKDKSEKADKPKEESKSKSEHKSDHKKADKKT